MNKNDFVSAIAAKSDMTKKDANAFLDAFVATLTQALASGESIQISGIGTFLVKERAARTGINPATKEKIEISASKAVGFKIAKALKDAVN